MTNNLLNGDSGIGTGVGVSSSSSSGSSACRVPFSPLLLIILAVLIKVKAKGSVNAMNDTLFSVCYYFSYLLLSHCFNFTKYSFCDFSMSFVKNVYFLPLTL